MAGEIEEPFRFDFQADNFHSGSISFGRFEAESLSWEKRSSFSHNRYLEEVEKYSRPGSVNEKKAYFEAHFRKKALLKQSSSESQDRGDYETSENDDGHDPEGTVDGNENNQFAFFDDSPGSSGYDEESEMREWEWENAGSIYSKHPVEPLIDSSNYLVSVPEHVKLEVTYEPESVNLMENNTLSDLDEVPVHKICSKKEMSSDKVSEEDVTLEVTDLPPTSIAAENDGSTTLGHQPTSSSKVKPASVSKQIESKSKSPAKVAEVQKLAVSESSSLMRPRMRGNQDLLTTKTEKKSPRPASPITRGRTSKSEDTSAPKAKIINSKRSIEKDLRTRRSVESQSSPVEKSLPRVRQTASRPTTITSSKPSMNQSAAGFSFKSEQRAERRKEFFMKLKEKMHAKEAVINQSEVEKQEKTEAEMKQFRKSLNFKATPVPSFYNGSTRGSDQNKVVSSNKKSDKLQSSSTPGVARTDRSPSNLKASNRPDRTEPSGLATSSAQYDPRPNSSTSVTSRNRSSEVAKNNDTTGRKEQERKKNDTTATISQRRKDSDGKKGQRLEEKRKAEAAKPRINRDMLRKDLKGVYMGNGSKIGYLTVGVTS